MSPTTSQPSDRDLPAVEELTYEQALGELEAIVAALESDERPLEEALALYERGQELARRCTDLLERAELRVRQLSGEELVDYEPPS